MKLNNEVNDLRAYNTRISREFDEWKQRTAFKSIKDNISRRKLQSMKCVFEHLLYKTLW